MKNRQAGGSLIKLMLILLLLGAAVTVALRVVPGIYNYYILTDLADRVVGDYAKLDLTEVNKRVKFELHRTRIMIDDETFVINQTELGYRVYVDYLIPMDFMLGSYELVLDGHENLTLRYEAESL
ncbi:MAG: hypothetical protein HQL68_05415 [Magnetococcales bacterium]|nr:hypothetical protein [Magnetococcales bacterium]